MATLAVLAAVVLPLFLYFYDSPTCFDNIKNGSEQGMDCGGSCERLCQSAFQPPNVAWTRLEEVAPGLYNVAAYIVNPNPAAEARNVPYHIALYDTSGVLINDLNGKVTIPPHRNTLAFRGAVSAGKRLPAKALFEFQAPPNWYEKKDTLSSLIIVNKEYLEEDTNSSLLVTLSNSGLEVIGPISVYAVLYDSEGNAVGFSKTTVDEIAIQGRAVAPFTWPISRDNKVISIEVLPVAE